MFHLDPFQCLLLREYIALQIFCEVKIAITFICSFKVAYEMKAADFLNGLDPSFATAFSKTWIINSKCEHLLSPANFCLRSSNLGESPAEFYRVELFYGIEL